jgi:hypothetical protein
MRIVGHRPIPFYLVLITVVIGSAMVLETCQPQLPKIRPALQWQAPDSSQGAFVEEHANTGFPLVGRHAQLPCEACHGERQPKPDCASCHTSPHDASLRRKCESCHTPGLPFQNVAFKHPAKGLFALHQDVPCIKCHEGKKFLKADVSCASCHEDFHKGSLGGDCYQCHRSAAWDAVTFNHNMTGFPLVGAHRGLECGDCHRDLQTFKIVPRPSECASCHEADYRNAPFQHAAYGAGRNCRECHMQDSWTYAHSPAWFNVTTGRHAGIACGTCHADPRDYRQYSCHACHAGHADDHSGRCLDCHSGGFGRGGGDD